MSKLLIEQLTEQVELNKTAEEVEFEKIAHVANVVDQAQTLSLVGEELYKIAEELENEDFAALAADIYQTGERMGSCLSKTASDSPAALEEAMEIAEDLNKLASVIVEIAQEINNEEFDKLAEAVVNISNEMTDDANEVIEAMEKEASEEAPAEEEAEEEVEKEAGVKDGAKKAWSSVKHHVVEKPKAFWKATDKDTGVPGASMKKSWRLKQFASKEGAKALAGPAGAAAALAAAGYGTKKAVEKKK